MNSVQAHPANAGVIRSLCQKRKGVVSVVAPEAVANPYYGCGSHPDIVERVWDQLGRALPASHCCILCGTPVLVHTETGVVLVISYGTSYCLRVLPEYMPVALRAGCKTSMRWTDGDVTDLPETLGADWVFGCWARDESEWCQATADFFVSQAAA